MTRGLRYKMIDDRIVLIEPVLKTVNPSVPKIHGMKVIRKSNKFMGDYQAVHGLMPKSELPKRMKKIPKNQVWIRASNWADEGRYTDWSRRSILLHERHELSLIKKGMGYRKAHEATINWVRSKIAYHRGKRSGLVRRQVRVRARKEAAKKLPKGKYLLVYWSPLWKIDDDVSKEAFDEIARKNDRTREFWSKIKLETAEDRPTINDILFTQRHEHGGYGDPDYKGLTDKMIHIITVHARSLGPRKNPSNYEEYVGHHNSIVTEASLIRRPPFSSSYRTILHSYIIEHCFIREYHQRSNKDKAKYFQNDRD